MLLILPGDVFPDDGERDGRRGNEFYEEGAFSDAAEAFASGLAVLEDDAELRLRYGLHNNLGAALLKSGDAAGARQSFDRALETAVADADLARTFYNAGNAAMAGQDLKAAVDYYRNSLLRDPNNEDAKFNYEFAKRQLDEQQQQQQQQQQGGSEESDDNRQEQQESGQQGEGGDQQDQQDQDSQEGSSQQEPQDGEQQEPQDGEQQEQQDPQEAEGAGPPEEQLSEEQAERILQALQNEEEQLLRQVQRPTGRPRRVEKDW